MKQVEARFTCQSRDHYEHAHGSQHEVKLTPVQDGGEFFLATPTGELTMGLMVPETAQFFEPGETYRVLFEMAPED